MCSDKKELTLKSAIGLTISFPEPHPIIKTEGEKTRELLTKKGYYDSADGKVYVDKNTVPHLLATDKAGANKIYNELNDDDKYENGVQKLISVPALQKEISERITEPRDTIQIERLKDSEQCLISLRDAQEIVRDRELQESKIRRDLPKLREEVIKKKNISQDECTGEKLHQPHAHHIIRRSDKPREALNLNNIAIVNEDTHHDIHAKEIHDKDDLIAYSDKNGGSLRNRIGNKD